MSDVEIDFTAWHADGHELTLKMGLWRPRPGTPGRTAGELRLEVKCPPDSVCARWHEAHHRTRPPDSNGEPHCFVRADIEAIGALDFIDGDLDASLLPDDWSSSVAGLEIEWRDQGEDGILWRPREASAAEAGQETAADGAHSGD